MSRGAASNLGVRLPAVAGAFYSSDAGTLARDVDRLIENGAMGTSLPPVRMLLSPHAGYVYSGAIAGAGFSRGRATALSRAFIIGPAHVEAFNYTSIYGGRCYRTPLGDVPVATDACRALASADASIRFSGAGHDAGDHQRGEHSIEVELPFLQRCFPGITIVPVVMGSQSWEACAALGHAIAKVVDWNRDILIASSDLSHFYDDSEARALDGVFCDTLLTLDALSLHDRITRRECEACGAGPVIAALIATESLRGRRAEILARGNSGDISQDRSSVVGYASAVVTGDPA